MKKVSVFISSLAFVFVINACSDSYTYSIDVLDNPIAFTITKPQSFNNEQGSLLFIANTGDDFVSVVDVVEDLTEADFIPAPVHYYPIMIAVPPAPSSLAASEDGHYVMVSSSFKGYISFIDSLTLTTVLDENDDQLVHVIGNSNSQISQLIHYQSCGLQCDTFLALDATGTVFEVNVSHTLDENNHVESITILHGRAFNAGNAPRHMMIDRATEQLWVAQAKQNPLRRIDLSTGTSIDLELGSSQTDVTLDHTGNYLFIGLQESRSIAIYHHPRLNTPQRVQNHVSFLPPDANSDETDIFLSEIPSRLSFISSLSPLTLRCYTDSSDNDTEVIAEYYNFLAVATKPGSISFIIPHSDADSYTDYDDALTDSLPQTFELANSTFCRQATVDADTDNSTLQWLQSCNENNTMGKCDQDTGITIYPGYTSTAEIDWEIVYEGPINSGYGSITAEGIFKADTLDISFEDRAIRTQQEHGVGDYIQILITPLTSEDHCVTLYGDEDQLALRRFEIISYDGTLITLDQSIDSSCFSENSASLPFEILANDSFTVYSPDYTSSDAVYYGRLSLGDSFGPNGNVGTTRTISFTIRSDACSAGELACEPYNSVTFTTQSPYAAYRAGVFSSGAVGNLPAQMEYLPWGRTISNEYEVRDNLLILFSGYTSSRHGLLLVLSSFDSNNFAIDDYYRVFE